MKVAASAPAVQQWLALPYPQAHTHSNVPWLICCREAIKRRSYLEQHKQRKAAAATREAQEGALIDAWPHGCPVAVLRDAGLAGLHPPALQHGTCDRPRCSRSPPGSC